MAPQRQAGTPTDEWPPVASEAKKATKKVKKAARKPARQEGHKDGSQKVLGEFILSTTFEINFLIHSLRWKATLFPRYPQILIHSLSPLLIPYKKLKDRNLHLLPSA